MSADPQLWGIQPSFYSASGQERTASESTVNSLLRALGADEGPPPDHRDGPLVVTLGKPPESPSDESDDTWTVVLESGERLDGSGALPDDLPLGYHRLSTANVHDRMLIVAPAACSSLQNAKWWGWTIQLYASRSAGSWGIGDFGDLRKFSELASSDGARFGIVNPLHAGLPSLPQEPSPYYPSSREFRNPLYLDIEDIAGASEVPEVNALAQRARSLNADRLIKRNEVWDLKVQALRAIWARTSLGSDFEKYVEKEGEGLSNYATFCALTEKHGRPWQHWPTEYRHPKSEAIIQFVRENRDEVRFHQWVQWLCERQFSNATVSMPFVQDLAIGVNPAGADAWLWQDVMALGVRVGAPPDEFNTRGQDWAIPPFDPWKLRAANYEPFIRTVRAALACGGGVRIDHVMGLFRLYWIPEGASAADGAYVRYPWKDLLAILALEGARYGGIVIGEDLGTIEHYMSEELERRNVLSYKLMWFQPEPPREYPVGALGAITTHDLPTVAGLFSDRDLEIQTELGMEPNVDATMDMKRRVGSWLDLDESSDPAQLGARAHRLLGESPCSVVSATLEDALSLVERPNYPGTTTEYPNWSVALPIDMDDLADDPGYRRTVQAFQATRGKPEDGQ